MVSYDHILIMITRSMIRITAKQLVLTNHMQFNLAERPQIEQNGVQSQA